MDTARWTFSAIIVAGVVRNCLGNDGAADHSGGLRDLPIRISPNPMEMTVDRDAVKAGFDGEAHHAETSCHLRGANRRRHKSTEKKPGSWKWRKRPVCLVAELRPSVLEAERCCPSLEAARNMGLTSGGVAQVAHS